MTISIFSRRVLTLLSVLIMGFLLLPNLTTKAQEILNEKSCRPQGWTPVEGTTENLVGAWSTFHNSNCKDNWQFSGTIVISADKRGRFSATMNGKDPVSVRVVGTRITFDRDMKNNLGPDKKKQYTQTWSGQLGTLKDGKLRVYGTWIGAYEDMRMEGYNSDFMLDKQP